MIKRDGHIHSPFCPHGSSDTMASYCERAIAHGIETITFTEHAPLPAALLIPTPAQDSAMKEADLPHYFSLINQLKKEYASHLDILTGLEIDYLIGYEQNTTTFLNDVGPFLDDSILSVHFLLINGSYYCMDYSPAVFKTMAKQLGSVDLLYKKYYETVLSSVKANLGSFKPKRVGHMTLCHKFRKKHPAKLSFNHEMNLILDAVKQNHMELDYNGAGVMKPDCGETYPPASIAQAALNKGIKLVYGSDAHSASALLAGVDQLHM
ncbi:LOW QUALITY PROTEIN: histidinol-phosphatase [Bacillus sp. JCM 19045]|nr:LOW QUALITY PROTEIN: histidinol-phosphatase [Bacillus sp. JCM 19045]